MKKDVFGKGKMAAAAAGLALAFAVGTTAALREAKLRAALPGEAAANSEEGGADVQKNSQEPENGESRRQNFQSTRRQIRLPWRIAPRRISCLKTWATV